MRRRHFCLYGRNGRAHIFLQQIWGVDSTVLLLAAGFCVGVAPSGLSCYPFTSPPSRKFVPSHSNRALSLHRPAGNLLQEQDRKLLIFDRQSSVGWANWVTRGVSHDCNTKIAVDFETYSFLHKSICRKSWDRGDHCLPRGTCEYMGCTFVGYVYVVILLVNIGRYNENVVTSVTSVWHYGYY
jgi:hypothetical protein